MLSSNIKIYKNVKIGKQSALGDFVTVGVSPKGKKDGETKTIIGSGAVIRSHSVIYAGNKIGKNFQTGHGTLIREENIIGDNVSIGSHTVVEHHIRIGDGVRIHSNTFIPEFSVLEKDCWIGPGVIFTNARYPKSKNAKKTLKGPIIKKGAIIGAGAVILPGVIIGERAFIGAGTVVVKEVKKEEVMVGNPARRIKKITDIKEYQS